MKVHTSHKRLGVNLELTHNELQTIKECKLTSDSDGSLNFKVLSIFLIPTRELEIAQSEQDVSPFCKESDMTDS